MADELYKDFDAGRQAKDRKQVTFKLFGRTWRARHIEDSEAMDLLAADNTKERAQAWKHVMSTLVVESEQEDFNKLWRYGVEPEYGTYRTWEGEGDDRHEVEHEWEPGASLPEGAEGIKDPVARIWALDTDEQQEVVEWVLEKQQGRPTTPSSRSSS